MNTLADQQLSPEVQEFYQQNKQWFSDVLHLDDETRFFQKILDHLLALVVNEEGLEEIKFIRLNLTELQTRRDQLKLLIIQQQHLLDSISKDQTNNIVLSLSEENIYIINEIKTLFISDKLIRKELFTLVEQVIGRDKAEHLLNA